jgi:Na+-translocating ferredoxin:NAD+ oxidoreductase RnfG subunit
MLKPSIAAALAVASTSVFAVDYLTAEQARLLLFPSATNFQEQVVLLSSTQLAAVAKIGNVNARSASWKLITAANKDGKLLGYVVVDNVIGKFELITYAVGVNVDGVVQGIEILSYRESHGYEVRLPFWRKQFVGKTIAQPIKISDDIAVISGATMSCNSLTDGVRRIVAMLAVLQSTKS